MKCDVIRYDMIWYRVMYCTAIYCDIIIVMIHSYDTYLVGRCLSTQQIVGLDWQIQSLCRPSPGLCIEWPWATWGRVERQWEGLHSRSQTGWRSTRASWVWQPQKARSKCRGWCTDRRIPSRVESTTRSIYNVRTCNANK